MGVAIAKWECGLFGEQSIPWKTLNRGAKAGLTFGRGRPFCGIQLGYAENKKLLYGVPLFQHKEKLAETEGRNQKHCKHMDLTIVIYICVRVLYRADTHEGKLQCRK